MQVGGKHNWYFYWGYNRASFGVSDLHFDGPNYDFTLYKLTAHDRPTTFNFKTYFSPKTISIPQYNYRVGRRLHGNWFVSIGVDHMKYVVDADQFSTISGVISATASEKYQGSFLQKPIQISRDFLRFEHSDGLSLLHLDVDYGFPLARLGQFTLVARPGIGGVWTVCRTDVALFDDRLNTAFHIAGYSVAGKTTLEIEWKNRFFFGWGVKLGYASLPDILIKTVDSPQRADQNIRFFEKYGMLGVRF